MYFLYNKFNVFHSQVLGKITEEGVFLEQLETNPSKYLPEVETKDLSDTVVQVCMSFGWLCGQ